MIQYFSQRLRSAITLTRNSSCNQRRQVAQPRTHNPSTLPAGNTQTPWNPVHRTNTAGENISIPDSWQGIPPYSYIRVSKLSCAACQMWIEGCNGQGGRQFFTRGSHGKWYWLWCIPQLHKVVLGPYMIDNISDTYYNYCPARDRM